MIHRRRAAGGRHVRMVAAPPRAFAVFIGSAAEAEGRVQGRNGRGEGGSFDGNRRSPQASLTGSPRPQLCNSRHARKAYPQAGAAGSSGRRTT